jgi:hypothetical protein
VSTPSRTAQVEGRDVVVSDGLVSAEESATYYRAITRASFTGSETAWPDAQDFPVPTDTDWT